MARLPDDWNALSLSQKGEFLRSLRYKTARQWASRCSRKRLEHIVALMVSRNRPGATIPRTRQAHETAHSFAEGAVRIWASVLLPTEN